MPKTIIQKIVVAAIILNQDKVLLLQRSAKEKIFPNLWELPSGKKDPLETTESALIREVKEETGLSFKKTELFSIFDYQIEKEKEIRDTTQINFIVESIESLEIILSPEHQSYAWVSFQELNQYNITDTIKDVIKEVFKKGKARSLVPDLM